MSSPDPRPPDRYELGRRLGAGGQSVVYAARDAQRDVEVAMKILSPEVDPEAGRNRMRREFLAMSRIAHPGVVEVYDFGLLSDRRPYFTMELVDGAPLTDALAGAPEPYVARVVLRILDALHHVHREGVVHGDVKPTNVLVKEGEPLQVKLLDFGLAAVGESPWQDGRLIRGSVHYLAPELIREIPMDGRADLYSLGASLYEALGGEALWAGDRPEEVLRKQLDVEPPPLAEVSPELGAIVARLLAKEPRLRYGGAAQVRADVVALSGRDEEEDWGSSATALLSGGLVGRETILDAALAAVDAARRGEGTVTLIEGGEGAGRSRLLSEIRMRAGLAGATVISAPPPTDVSPYATWRALAELLETEPREADQRVGTLFDDEPPEALGAPPEGSDLDVMGRTIRFFDATCRAIAEHTRSAGDRPEPVVLLIDDLDRRDVGTREFLTFLSRQMRELSLCVIATVTSPVEGRESYPEEARWLSLEPLSQTQSGRLVASMLGVEEIPRRLSSTIHEETGGNPADVEDFVRALVAEGAVTSRPEGGIEVRDDLVENVPTPRRMQDWIRGLVSSLDAESRMALSVASLLPQPFDPSLLSQTLGFSEELTFEVLGNLERAGVVRCRRGLYQFAAAKLQRHLDESLAPTSRWDLVDRIARALLARREEEGAGAVPDGLLASYLARGRTPQEAVPYLMGAADEAFAMLAVRDSVAYLKRAVELVLGDERGFDADVLNEVRERLAERLSDAGELYDAIGMYESLLLDLTPIPSEDRGDALEDPVVRLGVRVAKLHQRQGEYEQALDRLQKVLETLDRRADASMISEILARVGWIHKSRGVYEEAQKYCGRALKVAEEVGDATKIANALNHLGVIHYNKGDLVQAHHHFRRALRSLAGEHHAREDGSDDAEVMRRASGDPVRARVIVNNMGNVHWKRGEWDRATEVYGTALTLAERIGDLSGIASVANNIGLIQYGRGDWDGALAGFQRSLEIKSKLGETTGVSIALNNLAEVYERIGRWTEAREYYERSLELKTRLGERSGVGLLHLTLGNLDRKMGELDRASEEILTGFRILQEGGDTDALAMGHYYRGLLAKDREDFVAALRLLTDAVAMVERMKTFHEAGRIYTSAGDLYMRMGDLDKADEFARRSLELAQQLGDRFEEGKVLSVIGRLRYQRRERASAREAFEKGIEILEDQGARFELGRSVYEYGLRIEDPARASRYIEKAVGIFRSIGAKADLERASGTWERIRENLQGFDAPETRSSGEVVGLYEISSIMNSMRDFEEVLHQVMDIVLERTRADRGLILLLESDGELRVRAARNIDRENLAGLSEISASIVREVIRTQGAIMASNAGQDPRFSAQKSIIVHGIVSIAAVPLRIRERIAGAIYLDHLRSPDHFTDKDLRFLEAFADQAAIAIENARLYRELREASDRLAAENRVLRDETREAKTLEIVGRSRAMRRVVETARKAAATGETTLMLGESGTGKSFVAGALHEMGPRREGPFVKFNCAALPETLVESELFGHEKGSFTGADRRKLGRFEIASSGTIFLDEIGNISPSVQAKLLRILEDKEFERVGGTETIRTDVQIVAATNRDLDRAIRDGSFREDLFYRLNVFPIQLPPLRERKEDIPALAEFFLASLSRELGVRVYGFTSEALDLLMEYDWPGNVRELESAVRRAAVLAEEDSIRSEDLRWLRQTEQSAPRRELLLEEAVGAFVRAPRRGEKMYQAVTENVERVLIRQVLQECDGQIREATRRLGVSRNTLRSKMRRYGLSSDSAD